MYATGPRRRWIRDLLGWKTIRDTSRSCLLRLATGEARGVTLTSYGLTTPGTVLPRRRTLNRVTGDFGPSKSAPSKYRARVPGESTGGQCQRLFNIIFPGGFRRRTPRWNSCQGVQPLRRGKLRAIDPWLLRPCRGEVPERPNGRDWKSRRGYRLSRVQIPPSPPDYFPHPH